MQAMRFIAGGEARDMFVDAQAQALYELAAGRAVDSQRVWWAVDRQCVAAAMVLDYPGRSGFLFYSPVTCPGVSRPAVVELARSISADAVANGLYFVQVILQPQCRTEIETLTEAGYRPLAELLYMRLALPPGRSAGAGRDGLQWRSFGQFTEQELGEMIRATYVDSLDCPQLAGLRSMDDVIAAHKVSGTFCPDSWWIVHRDGQPAGCILVNDSRSGGASDIVYMGVHWQHRRSGLAAAMLEHAALDAARRGRQSLTLAVDLRNQPALRVYRRMGFEGSESRLAYAFFADR